MHSTIVKGPGPRMISRKGPPCKLCGNKKDIRIIHFPPFQFSSGNFKAVPWFEHKKYHCPKCQFIWADWLEGLTLENYGKKYAKANTDEQRRPTESRMIQGFLILRKIIHNWGGKRFLDYGVGYNFPYIYELRGKGIDLLGCDISNALVYSKFIKQLPFEKLPEKSFDGVYSTSVFEHLADFEKDLEYMKKLLVPGGIMIHAWDMYPDWEGHSDFPRDPMVWDPWHVSIFSDTSARVLAYKLNLIYLGTKKVGYGGGKAFIFKKPGINIKNKLRWISPLHWCYIIRLFKHQLYLRRYYPEVYKTYTIKSLARKIKKLINLKNKEQNS